jgi:hypothetical protein
VEQACLATGASGAALVLERDGEWVCRASAGGNAPQLGARLNAESGLSGACVKTRTAQRCDDAQNDSRVDSEACRVLGVRSVIVLPLLQNGELAGIFEAFSMWPAAFGERDERTLEALSHRVLGNLERASSPISAGGEASRGKPDVEDVIATSTAASAVANDAPSNTTSDATFDGNQGAEERPLIQPVGEAVPGRKMNLVTLALSAAVLAYAVLLTVLVAQRLSGRRATARVRVPAAVSAPVVAAASPSTEAAGNAASLTSTSASGSQSAGSKSSTVSAAASTGPAAGATHARDTSPPAGSLQVYENGKEIFRMNPPAERSGAISASRSQPAASG